MFLTNFNWRDKFFEMASGGEHLLIDLTDPGDLQQVLSDGYFTPIGSPVRTVQPSLFDTPNELFFKTQQQAEALLKTPLLLPEHPTSREQMFDAFEDNMIGLINRFLQDVARGLHLSGVQRAYFNYGTDNDVIKNNDDDSNDVEEVEIGSGESSLTFTQRQSPILAPRQTLTSPIARPIPAEQRSHQGSHHSSTLNVLSLDQRQNPPWDNPNLAPEIQEQMRTKYLQLEIQSTDFLLEAS